VGFLRHGELTHPILSKPYTRFVPFYEKFGLEPSAYIFQACDSLLEIVKDELARHGVVDPPLSHPDDSKVTIIKPDMTDAGA
jgi:hypothetical protein